MRRLPLALPLAVAVLVSGAVAAHAAPAIGFAVTSALTGTQRVTFSEPVTGVTHDNVVFRVAGTTAALATTLTCRDANAAVVSCAMGAVRVVLIDPSGVLVAGEGYEIVVDPSDAPTSIVGSGGPIPTTTRSFRASTSEQQDSAGASYRWQSQSDSRALGGSYVREHTALAQAAFRFTSTGVTWFSKRGPTEGQAAVYIDGRLVRTINNYASSFSYQVPLRFGGFTNARHSILVRVLGRAGGRGGGTYVSIDGFRRNGTSVIEDAQSYAWRTVRDTRASSGSYVLANQARQAMTFRFRGGGVDWFTKTGPSQGIANVYIDGRFVRSYDTYNPSVVYGVHRTVTGLADTQHTLTIAVAYGKNSRSAGTWIAVDRFVLRASVNAFRGLGAWFDLFDYTSSTTRSDIDALVADLRARHVKTVYVETARYNSTAAFDFRAQIGMWIDSAHAAGIRVVGWYLPAYGSYIDVDVARTVAVATYRSPGGSGFDGLGIDIEVRTKTTHAQFMTDVTRHLARVRAGVGLVFPIAAITMAPLDMDRAPSYWSGFPWSSIGRYADVEMPMSYWTVSSDRSRCADGTASYCPYGFASGNTTRSRSYTGLPVHLAGGVANAFAAYTSATGRSTMSQINDFVRGANDARAIGGSLYDYRSMYGYNRSIIDQIWSALQPLN